MGCNQKQIFLQRKTKRPKCSLFHPENFNITNDRKTDVSNELQKAINQLKTTNSFGKEYTTLQ